MLRACHRLLKPGGRIAFTTIYIVPGVSERVYRRAARARGPGAAERRTMVELCERAGFTAVREHDVTREFARTTRTFLELAERHEAALRAAWGDARFDESQSSRRATLQLVQEGAVRRAIFTATAAR